MKEHKDEFFAFLDERKADTLNKAAELAADNRKDESNLLKAKANIYGIFKAIWEACEKMDSGDFKEAFMRRSAPIYGQWERALEKAKTHNDAIGIVLEETKLSAVQEIKDKVDTY